MEALGGLSHRYMRKVPPCFWASAGPAASSITAADAMATIRARYGMISSHISVLGMALLAPAPGCVDGRPVRAFLLRQHERCRRCLASATGVDCGQLVICPEFAARQLSGSRVH